MALAYTVKKTDRLLRFNTTSQDAVVTLLPFVQTPNAPYEIHRTSTGDGHTVTVRVDPATADFLLPGGATSIVLDDTNHAVAIKIPAGGQSPAFVNTGGGAGGGGGGPTATPPAPLFSVQQDPADLSAIQIYSVHFATPTDPLIATITSGLFAFSYVDADSVGYSLTAAVTNTATSISLSAPPSNIANGDYIQIGPEIMLAGTPSGSTLPVTRAQMTSTAVAHTSGNAVWKLTRRVSTVSYPANFFVSPLSASALAWTFTLPLPGALVSSVAGSVANALGSSPITTVLLTGLIDNGIQLISASSTDYNAAELAGITATPTYGLLSNSSAFSFAGQIHVAETDPAWPNTAQISVVAFGPPNSDAPSGAEIARLYAPFTVNATLHQVAYTGEKVSFLQAAVAESWSIVATPYDHLGHPGHSPVTASSITVPPASVASITAAEQLPRYHDGNASVRTRFSCTITTTGGQAPMIITIWRSVDGGTNSWNQGWFKLTTSPQTFTLPDPGMVPDGYYAPDTADESWIFYAAAGALSDSTPVAGAAFTSAIPMVKLAKPLATGVTNAASSGAQAITDGAGIPNWSINDVHWTDPNITIPGPANYDINCFKTVLTFQCTDNAGNPAPNATSANDMGGDEVAIAEFVVRGQTVQTVNTINSYGYNPAILTFAWSPYPANTNPNPFHFACLRIYSLNRNASSFRDTPNATAQTCWAASAPRGLYDFSAAPPGVTLTPAIPPQIPAVTASATGYNVPFGNLWQLGFYITWSAPAGNYNIRVVKISPMSRATSGVPQQSTIDTVQGPFTAGQACALTSDAIDVGQVSPETWTIRFIPVNANGVAGPTTDIPVIVNPSTFSSVTCLEVPGSRTNVVPGDPTASSLRGLLCSVKFTVTLAYNEGGSTWPQQVRAWIRYNRGSGAGIETILLGSFGIQGLGGSPTADFTIPSVWVSTDHMSSTNLVKIICAIWVSDSMLPPAETLNNMGSFPMDPPATPIFGTGPSSLATVDRIDYPPIPGGFAWAWHMLTVPQVPFGDANFKAIEFTTQKYSNSGIIGATTGGAVAASDVEGIERNFGGSGSGASPYLNVTVNWDGVSLYGSVVATLLTLWTMPSATNPDGSTNTFRRYALRVKHSRQDNSKVVVSCWAGSPGGPSVAGPSGEITYWGDRVEIIPLITKAGLSTGALSIVFPGPNAVVNVAYNGSLAATGGTQPYTFSIASGALPIPPLTLNATTGAITGTPTATGTYTFVGRVTDATGAIATTPSNTFIVAATPPTTGALTLLFSGADANVGVSYTASFSAFGGVLPYTFAIISGSLPPGFGAINSTTGQITGTPTTSGPYSFTCRVTDGASTTLTAAGSIFVNAGGVSTGLSVSAVVLNAVFYQNWANAIVPVFSGTITLPPTGTPNYSSMWAIYVLAVSPPALGSVSTNIQVITNLSTSPVTFSNFDSSIVCPPAGSADQAGWTIGVQCVNVAGVALGSTVTAGPVTVKAQSSTSLGLISGVSIAESGKTPGSAVAREQIPPGGSTWTSVTVTVTYSATQNTVPVFSIWHSFNSGTTKAWYGWAQGKSGSNTSTTVLNFIIPLGNNNYQVFVAPGTTNYNDPPPANIVPSNILFSPAMNIGIPSPTPGPGNVSILSATTVTGATPTQSSIFMGTNSNSVPFAEVLIKCATAGVTDTAPFFYELWIAWVDASRNQVAPGGAGNNFGWIKAWEFPNDGTLGVFDDQITYPTGDYYLEFRVYGRSRNYTAVMPPVASDAATTRMLWPTASPFNGLDYFLLHVGNTPGQQPQIALTPSMGSNTNPGLSILSNPSFESGTPGQIMANSGVAGPGFLYPGWVVDCTQSSTSIVTLSPPGTTGHSGPGFIRLTGSSTVIKQGFSIVAGVPIYISYYVQSGGPNTGTPQLDVTIFYLDRAQGLIGQSTIGTNVAPYVSWSLISIIIPASAVLAGANLGILAFKTHFAAPATGTWDIDDVIVQQPTQQNNSGLTQSMGANTLPVGIHHTAFSTTAKSYFGTDQLYAVASDGTVFNLTMSAGTMNLLMTTVTGPGPSAWNGFQFKAQTAGSVVQVYQSGSGKTGVNSQIKDLFGNTWYIWNGIIVG